MRVVGQISIALLDLWVSILRFFWTKSRKSQQNTAVIDCLRRLSSIKKAKLSTNASAPPIGDLRSLSIIFRNWQLNKSLLSFRIYKGNNGYKSPENSLKNMSQI